MSSGITKLRNCLLWTLIIFKHLSNTKNNLNKKFEPVIKCGQMEWLFKNGQNFVSTNQEIFKKLEILNHFIKEVITTITIYNTIVY